MEPERNQTDRMLIDTIRGLYVECGGKLDYPQDAFGVNPSQRSVSGGIEVAFYQGDPTAMYTSEGRYTILGGRTYANKKQFWDRFNQEFDVTVRTPEGRVERVNVDELSEKCRYDESRVNITQRGA